MVVRSSQERIQHSQGVRPEVLVLGKHTRLPGSVCSDELLPAHMLADADTAQGVQFRLQLARRESARRAFVQADNDAALRKAILRKSRGTPKSYAPGEWVMVWREGKGANPSQRVGPMKVVVHENAQTIWVTMASKLHRAAPEHVRPVSAMEARDIVIFPNEPSISIIAQQIPRTNIPQPIHNPMPDMSLPDSTVVTPSINDPSNNGNPNVSNNPHLNNPDDASEQQPDAEPGEASNSPSPTGSQHGPVSELDPVRDREHGEIAQKTPLPDETEDDDLICEGLHCQDLESESFELHDSQAWRCEVLLTESDIQDWRREENPFECAFLATAAKRQRSEVKLSTLDHNEKAEFQKAKDQEIQNWLKTGTISKILRHQVPQDQILRCRWILTWKTIDDEEKEKLKLTKNVKAKARLVILGYLDPKLMKCHEIHPHLEDTRKCSYSS